MNAWWRMVVATVALTGLMTLALALAPSVNQSELPVVTPSVTAATTQSVKPIAPAVTLTPKVPSSTPSLVPPHQPSRLDVGGAFPIHTHVLPYAGDVLEPPNGDYRDAFIWTQRGLPGDGATDTTYLFGHTYRGPTAGVFDELQKVAIGTRVQLTTSGPLNYCVTSRFTVNRARLDSDPRVWALQPYSQRGNMLVLIACFLNADGSPQDKNIVVVAERCK